MPKYGRTRYKRDSFNRGPKRWKVKDYHSVAQTALTTAYGLYKLKKELFNAEKLYKDRAVSLTPDASGGNTSNVLCLTNIAQGDQYYERQGNSIRLNSIHAKLTLFKNSSATATVVNIMLVRDNNAAEGEPVADDILTGTPIYDGLINKKNIGRFQILMRRSIVVSSGSEYVKQIQFNKKITTHVKFTNGNVTDRAGKGHIYFIALSNQNTLTPTLTGTIRAQYIDN